MHKFLFIGLLSITQLAFISPVLSETGPDVEVAVIATGMENLTPMGVAEKFSAQAGRLYCYSKIIGAEGSSIKHIWYYGDKKVSEIVLDVKYPNFRTYSYKTIPPNWIGKWRVEIVANDGAVLKTVEFNIE